MSGDQDPAPDLTALLAAFGALPGVDHDVIRQAQKAMAEAMAVGAENQAFLERQWTIMQATADAVRGADQPLDAMRQLDQARACFDVAVDAVRALSEAASASGGETMDQVVRRFQADMDRLRDNDNK